MGEDLQSECEERGGCEEGGEAGEEGEVVLFEEAGARSGECGGGCGGVFEEEEVDKEWGVRGEGGEDSGEGREGDGAWEVEGDVHDRWGDILRNGLRDGPIWVSARKGQAPVLRSWLGVCTKYNNAASREAVCSIEVSI